ncbi:MAG: hypothetical protein M3347_04200 [Armatimonadota bacterium]|nr:hypothetical protein [Armatimonadota bacterium]
MNIPNPSPLLRSFYTITEKLERLEKENQEIRQELAALRTDCTHLVTRIAVMETKLEQSQKTFEAQLRAVVAETVADLRVRYAETQAQSTGHQSSPSLPLSEDDSSEGGS